jgi:hypothetical protein
MEKKVARPLTNTNAIIGKFNGCARRYGEGELVIVLTDQIASMVKANI